MENLNIAGAGQSDCISEICAGTSSGKTQVTRQRDWIGAAKVRDGLEIGRSGAAPQRERSCPRSVGGTVDVEFAVQMLQLRYGGKDAKIRVPGTLEALAALHAAGYLAKEDFEHFSQSYRHLRSVESRIRLMNSAGRHELPVDDRELRRLAYLLNVPDAHTLITQTELCTTENRRRFDRLFESVLAGSV